MTLIDYSTEVPTVRIEKGEEIRCCVPVCPTHMRSGDQVYVIPFDTGDEPLIMCGRYGKTYYGWTRAKIE